MALHYYTLIATCGDISLTLCPDVLSSVASFLLLYFRLVRSIYSPSTYHRSSLGRTPICMIKYTVYIVVRSKVRFLPEISALRRVIVM
jgi:hypothetical protein